MTDSNFKLPGTESIEIEYEVQVSGEPPEATESTATLFKHSPGGEVLETKELVKTGGSTVSFALSQRTLEDSPLWVQFHFARDDARVAAVDPAPIAYPLGAPEVARITVPADAKVDQALELKVETWGARVVDQPGTITFEPEMELDRVPADVKSSVRWKVNGTELDTTGETVNYTVLAESEGFELDVVAFVADPTEGEPARARATVAVPILTIVPEGGEPAAADGNAAPADDNAAGDNAAADGNAAGGEDDAPPPLSLLVGRDTQLNAVLEPSVPGTYAWEATAGADKVTLTPSEDGKSVVVRGSALSDEAAVTLKVKFTSEATSTEWTGERTATVFDGFAVKELYLKSVADASLRSKSYAPPPAEEEEAEAEAEEADAAEPAEDGAGEAQQGEAVTGEGGEDPAEAEEDAAGEEEAEGDEAPGEFAPATETEAAPAAAAPEGTDDFHFAPETETVKLFWKIDDKGALITGGRLELRDKATDRVLWTRALVEGEWTDGDHESDWNGQLDAEDATKRLFPDEFVTIERSPYKLTLILTGELAGEALPGKPDTAWTFFEVHPHSIELALGPRATLSRAKDRVVYDQLGGALPAADATSPKKVRLQSNIFITSLAEMNDETLYTQYDTLWGDGPNIPIVAKLFFKQSDGAKVEAPKALGLVKFMWNWTDRPESTSWIHVGARAFLNATLDCYKSSTLPRGDNCHMDHGGKRGSTTKKVFPNQTGYAAQATLRRSGFPFKVEAGRRRTWAAFSTGWGKGALAGMTGAVFQPSRMAGDSYVVSCYLAHEKRPDGSPVLDTTIRATIDAATIKAETGPFQVWREVHMRQYLKKKSTLTDFSATTFQGYYRQAYVLMVKKWSGGATAMTEADYNAKIAAGFAALPNWYSQMMEPPTAGAGAVNQYTVGTGAVTFRTFAEWKAAVMANPGTAPAGPWTDAQFTTWATGVGMHTANAYHGKCKALAKKIVETAAGLWLHASPGANFFQFLGLHNHENAPGGQSLNGWGMTLAVAGRTKASFAVCADASAYTGTGNSIEQTTAHEIGHTCFLPHDVNGATVPGGAQAAFHDVAFNHCTMSYNWAAGERKFCGLCMLRLRGWSRIDRRGAAGGHGIDNTQANNTKT